MEEIRLKNSLIVNTIQKLFSFNLFEKTGFLF
jgi:hypothetical protein